MDKDSIINQAVLLWNVQPKEKLFEVLPKQDGWTNKKILQSWMSLLPDSFQNEITGALGQKQPFMSNSLTSDMFLEENKHLHCNQLTVLYTILVHSVDWAEYALASALVFIVDRISYRYSHSDQLFLILDYILNQVPTTPVSPQVILRKARLMKDTGDLHGAMSVLNSLENKEIKWDYKTNEQYVNVKGVCVQIKGQIYHNLGLWKEAMIPLVGSIEHFDSLGDNKGISYSYGLLTRCLAKITPEDFNDMKTRFPSHFEQNHPYYEGYQLSRKNINIIKKEKFGEAMFTTRHQISGIECLLMYAIQKNSVQEKYNMYDFILHDVKFCLEFNRKVTALNSSEHFFEFIRCLFMISLTLSFSILKQDRKLARYLEQITIELYAHLCYCKQTDKFDHNPQTVKLMNGALTILGMPELEDTDAFLRDLHSDPKHSDEEPSSEEATDKKKNDFRSHTVPSFKSSGKSYMVDKSATVPTNHSFDRNFVGQVLDADIFWVPFSMDKEESSDSPTQHLDSTDSEDRSLTDLSVSSISHASKGSFDKLKNIQLLKPNPSVTKGQQESLSSFEKIPDTSSADSSDSTNKTSSSSSSSSHKAMPSPKEKPLAQSHTSSSSLSDSDRSVFSATTTSLFSEDTVSSDLPSDWEVVPLVNIESPDVLGRLEDLNLGNSSSTSSSVDYLLNWKIEDSSLSSSISRAQLLSYNAVNGQWRSQSTLAFIGQEIKLSEGKKGHFRDVYNITFLHQDEPLGRYVCKRYKKQRPPVCYMQDVICQMVAGYYVTKFNDAMLNFHTDLRVQFLPVAHLQLLTYEGKLLDWVNIEPYLHGTFNKLTNNWKYLNNEIEETQFKNAKDLATALSHFSYCESNGSLMLVDIQGWLPSNKTGIVYLTDPLFHTSGIQKFSVGDHKEEGMDQFWNHVHTSCNDICKHLNLKRP